MPCLNPKSLFPNRQLIISPLLKLDFAPAELFSKEDTVMIYLKLLFWEGKYKIIVTVALGCWSRIVYKLSISDLI